MKDNIYLFFSLFKFLLKIIKNKIIYSISIFHINSKKNVSKNYYKITKIIKHIIIMVYVLYFLLLVCIQITIYYHPISYELKWIFIVSVMILAILSMPSTPINNEFTDYIINSNYSISKKKKLIIMNWILGVVVSSILFLIILLPFILFQCFVNKLVGFNSVFKYWYIIFILGLLISYLSFACFVIKRYANLYVNHCFIAIIYISICFYIPYITKKLSAFINIYINRKSTLDLLNNLNIKKYIDLGISYIRFNSIYYIIGFGIILIIIFLFIYTSKFIFENKLNKILKKKSNGVLSKVYNGITVDLFRRYGLIDMDFLVVFFVSNLILSFNVNGEDSLYISIIISVYLLFDLHIKDNQLNYILLLRQNSVRQSKAVLMYSVYILMKLIAFLILFFMVNRKYLLIYYMGNSSILSIIILLSLIVVFVNTIYVFYGIINGSLLINIYKYSILIFGTLVAVIIYVLRSILKIKLVSVISLGIIFITITYLYILKKINEYILRGRL